MMAPVSFSRWFGEMAQRMPPRLKAPVATSPGLFKRAHQQILDSDTSSS